jgi:hypothetical protein
LAEKLKSIKEDGVEFANWKAMFKGHYDDLRIIETEGSGYFDSVFKVTAVSRTLFFRKLTISLADECEGKTTYSKISLFMGFLIALIDW